MIPKENVKVIVPSDKTLTDASFVNVVDTIRIEVQNEIEGGDPKTKKLGAGEIFQGMEVEVNKFGGHEGRGIIGDVGVVKYTPTRETARGTKGGGPIELFHVTCKKKSVEIAAKDLLRDDDILYSMVVAAKASADELGTKVFKIANCENNPAAAFKLYLLGKCQGMTPHFVDEPGRKHATENAIINAPFGELTLRTKD